MKEALFYRGLENKSVKCSLCNHYCKIAQGRTGTCTVRKNMEGVLYSMVYERVSALAIDPIEKKPLYHFLPGTQSLSVATVGCNFKCDFCQNASLSQAEPSDFNADHMPATDLVGQAVSGGAASISYTYSEPTVFFEYAFDIGTLAREKGIKNVFVTNGFMSTESRSHLLRFLDAANIDLKSFSEKTYKDVMGAKLQPVLDNIQALHQAGVFIEVTTLLVPGLNDSEEEIRDITAFLAAVSPALPWHVSRFHPDYRMQDRPATPADRMKRALEIGAEAGLKHIYAGNIHLEGRENTYCSACNELLIRRFGYQQPDIYLKEKGKCPKCGTPLYGVFN